MVGIRSLLTPQARGYTDGYLYSIIRYGRGLMPMYGDKLPNPTHRWAIVNHVRALQAATPPADYDGREAVMAPRKLRQRLVEASLAGRYDIHLGVGLGLALLGLVLFPLALRGEGADRAWQMFHVNWIYFTGITGGSIAFAAVHKLVNARWSGLVIRFAEAVVAFAPVSLLGCVLVYTVGYPHIYGHMQEQLPALSHGKAGVAVA